VDGGGTGKRPSNVREAAPCRNASTLERGARPHRKTGDGQNFANAEIEAVARAMASNAGRTVVLDSRVKDPIILSTETPVTPLVFKRRKSPPQFVVHDVVTTLQFTPSSLSLVPRYAEPVRIQPQGET
jgi:hypothetical protein